MKVVLKRVVLLLIVLGLALPVSGCACARIALDVASLMTTPSPEPRPTITPVPLPNGDHADVQFSDMVYTRPDTAALSDSIDALMADIEAGKPVSELLSSYEAVQRRYNAADSEMALAYLLYAFDVTDDTYLDEYTALESELTKLDLAMTDVSIALFESSDEAERGATDAFGEEYVSTVYEEETLNSEAVADLQDAETELVTEYDRLASSFTILSKGKRWTLDDIQNDETLDYDAYLALYDDYCAAFNARAGQIFIELLGIRKQIAERLGYGSYAAYGYDLYGRDYTVEQARALEEAVKRYIVPVYLAADDDTDEMVALYAERFDEQQFFDALTVAVTKFSRDLAEALGYMLENKLYDTSVSEKKMTGSFTTYLADYNAPFLFTQWSGSSADPTTVIHELGHFTNYYHNAVVGWSATDSLDLAEVDSQALELLMTDYYEMFYGDLAETAERDRLLDALYAIVSGCMEDEFQQAVYADPTMTLTEINALYRRLASEYGFDELYDYKGTEWTMIPHTFQTPMYYISYAVSMLPALELWERQGTDSDGAQRAYFSILRRAPYAGFQETLEANGLSPVFRDATIERLAKVIEENL